MYFLLSGILFIFAGCSSSITSDSILPKDKNISTIETVLKQQFTGPDKELVKLLNDPENATVIGNNKETTAKTPTELELYLDKLYKPYFIENMYSQYIG